MNATLNTLSLVFSMNPILSAVLVAGIAFGFLFFYGVGRYKTFLTTENRIKVIAKRFSCSGLRFAADNGTNFAERSRIYFTLAPSRMPSVAIVSGVSRELFGLTRNVTGRYLSIYPSGDERMPFSGGIHGRSTGNSELVAEVNKIVIAREPQRGDRSNLKKDDFNPRRIMISDRSGIWQNAYRNSQETSRFYRDNRPGACYSAIPPAL